MRLRGRLAGICLASACLAGSAAAAPGPDDVRNTSLSGSDPAWSASVPMIATDPADPRRVAVIWRALSMDDAGAPTGQRRMVCHLSLSDDGGRSFASRALSWDAPETPICNAPFVDIGPSGELMIGATLAGALPQNAPAGTHVPGRVVMRLSSDWGGTWSPVSSAIATGDEARFVPNAAVPEAATHVPWDGARGVIDRETGDITLSGGFPAPPGEALHSQRFYATSHDGGRTWGPIRAFAAPGWPQRWDGHLRAGRGKLAISYLADAVPAPGAACLCVVFATSTDGGVTFERHYVTSVAGFDTLVHYPPIAAHPEHANTYALALVEADGIAPIVRVTADDGATWQTVASPARPKGIVRVSRPALAYAPDGRLVLIWRGHYADGGYDMFAAAARDGAGFSPAVRLSTARSAPPPALANDYAVRGDFIAVVATGPDAIHAAWTDWRSGRTGEVVYGRVALAALE